MRPRSVIDALVIGALLLAGSALAVESKVCVPGENRRWLCGSAADPPKAAAPAELPAPPPPPLPPVLLIDPERLYGPAPQAPIRPLPAESIPDAPVSVESPAPGEPGAVANAPEASTAPDRPEPVRRGSHTWQLARASTAAGFAGLLRVRGIDPAQVREIRTRRGDWLLLYGDFPDVEAARGARSRAGEGFARAWKDIDAER